jgi:hypothetical protein
MKLFHTENGKEVVYVQMQDIVHLHRSSTTIPASVCTKVFNGTLIVTDLNRFDFVRFDEEHEVKFFRELDFIIDYDQYKDLTDKQLNEEFFNFAVKSNKIAEKWNSMPTYQREKNFDMLQEYENLTYILDSLEEIYEIKHHKKTMPFPNFVQIP